MHVWSPICLEKSQILLSSHGTNGISGASEFGSKTIKYEKKFRQVCKFAQHSRQLRCLHSLSSILHLSDNKLKQNQRAGQGECCNYCESLWICDRKDLTLTPILNKV